MKLLKAGCDYILKDCGGTSLCDGGNVSNPRPKYRPLRNKKAILTAVPHGHVVPYASSKSWSKRKQLRVGGDDEQRGGAGSGTTGR